VASQRARHSILQISRRRYLMPASGATRRPRTLIRAGRGVLSE